MLTVMSEPLRRIPIGQIAYLVVFGGFVGLSLYKLVAGTGTKFTWFFLVVGAFLFAATAYRLIRDFGKHDS